MRIPDDPRLELPDSEVECRACCGEGRVNTPDEETAECDACEGTGTRSRAGLRAEADEVRAEMKADSLRDDDDKL